MSTPQKPLSDAADHTCCDGHAPFPGWFRYYRPFCDGCDNSEAGCRARCVAGWDNPDRLWCPGCSTFLEDFRDDLAQALPTFLAELATVASFIPGFGTVAADILGTMAALAAGESIEDALVSGVLSALPGGPLWQVAGTFAYGVLDGQRLDRAAVSSVRAGIYEVGGPLAAAAYDGVLALAQGKAIQDAGFAALKELARGNTLAEKAAAYAEVIVRAAESGRSVPAQLVAELAADVAGVVGVGVGSALQSVIDRIKADPSLVAVGSDALALALGVAEPVARAAQAVMRTGAEDTALAGAIRSAVLSGVTVGFSSVGQSNADHALNAMGFESKSQADERHARLMATPVHALPSFATSNTARIVAALGAAPVVASVVAAPRLVAPAPPPVAVKGSPKTSSASRTGVAGDLVLGGTVGAAALALVWFFKS